MPADQAPDAAAFRPCPTGGADPWYRLTFPGEASAVREGLTRLTACPPLDHLGPEDRGTAELLLAEALNNIVEHAYARYSGEIAVALRTEGEDILVQIRDQGLPMPDDTLPEGKLPEIGAEADLPEGGFGWFLIRSLSRNLSYRRLDGVNELTFHIPVENWTQER